jgi:hypothetical protein
VYSALEALTSFGTVEKMLNVLVSLVLSVGLIAGMLSLLQTWSQPVQTPLSKAQWAAWRYHYPLLDAWLAAWEFPLSPRRWARLLWEMRRSVLALLLPTKP